MRRYDAALAAMPPALRRALRALVEIQGLEHLGVLGGRLAACGAEQAPEQARSGADEPAADEPIGLASKDPCPR